MSITTSNALTLAFDGYKSGKAIWIAGVVGVSLSNHRMAYKAQSGAKVRNLLGVFGGVGWV